MFNRATILISVLCMLSSSAISEDALLDAVLEDQWQLIWEDEFDGPINEAFWDIQLGPRKDSIRTRDNAFTENGNLVLRTSKVGDEYHTGFLRTRRLSRLLVAQKFGYFEARIKLDTAPGQWSAFWLMPKGTIHNNNNSGRDGTEIDIVEGFGRVPNTSISQAIHYDGYGILKQKSKNNRYELPGRVEDWRVYGLRWCSGSYTWYVDGRQTWKIDDPNLISQVEQYILLTSEVVLGTKWAGTMDDDRLPADTKVDYVRMYKSVSEDECPAIPVSVR